MSANQALWSLGEAHSAECPIPQESVKVGVLLVQGIHTTKKRFEMHSFNDRLFRIAESKTSDANSTLTVNPDINFTYQK
jgi:hypothetical protein